MRSVLWILAAGAIAGGIAVQPTSCAGDTLTVPVPELAGLYVARHTVRTATVDFGRPLIDPRNLRIHCRGEFSAFIGVVDGQYYYVRGGCLRVSLGNPDPMAYMSVCMPDAYDWLAFDTTERASYSDLSPLSEGRVTLTVDATRYVAPLRALVERELSVLLESIEVLVDEAVPVDQSSWGSVKSLYR